MPRRDPKKSKKRSKPRDSSPSPTPEELVTLTNLIDAIEQTSDWSEVESYLSSISPSLLRSSVLHRNENDSTPLHSACRFSPPLSILREFLTAAPEMAMWSDVFGWLPLHYACANGASTSAIRILLDAYPGGSVECDKRSRTPLHFALCHTDSYVASEELVRLLVRPFQERSAASIKDEHDMLPIHYACAYGSDEEVLHCIIEGYDSGIQMVDFKGRTPLHFAMGNSDRENSVEVMKMLLELKDMNREEEEIWMENTNGELDESSVSMVGTTFGTSKKKKKMNMVDLMDHENNLPLHLLSKKAKDLTKQEKELLSTPTMNDEGEQDYELQNQATSLVMSKERIRKCLQLYLSAKPETTSMFLTGIQFLPDWIRDEAVLHPTIQHMLNDRISHRFPTMILLLDFYLNIAIIACFTAVSLHSAELRSDSSNTTMDSKAVSSPLLVILYFGSAYFVLREISQAISVKLQRGMFAYFRDPENIVNLSFIFLTITFTMVIANGWGSNDFFHGGSGITIGFCYLQILAYLRTVSIDFAVFVSGLSYVVLRLGAFLSILGITIMAFAQMWYTIFKGNEVCMVDENVTSIAAFMDDLIFQYYDDGFFLPTPEELEDCEPQIDLPYCEGLGYSIYKTFTMLFGLGDGLLELNTMSLILSCIWLFIAILMILNLLIGIICDLFGAATKEQAAIVFWTKRLAFVTDMDWVVHGPWKKKVGAIFKCCNKQRDDSEMKYMLPSTNIDTVYRSQKSWGRFIRSFDPSRDSSCKMFLLRIVVWFFIVPFWLILGIFTAGWFWPPQLREGLFKQKIYIKEESPDDERFESLKLAGKDLTGAKNEIVQQFVVDRKGMKRVRERTRTVRKEIKDELRNMKGVMTSLYEIQQQMMS